MEKTATSPRTRRKLDWGKIDDEIDKSEKGGFRNDGYSENLFVPKLKQDGTYQAVIRFLPRPEGDGIVPWVKLMNHGFKDLGGWFIENCPTTLSNECPICKANSKLWNDGEEETVKRRGRRTSYFTNVLVITDPQNQDNEGKVFIFRFGKTLYEMIREKVKPSVDSIDEKVHIFDYDEGMNFKLKIKPKKTGNQTYNNYDASEFTGQKTKLNDEEVESIEKQLYVLGDIIGKDKFKSYKELETLFKQKIGDTTIPEKEEKSEEKSEDESGVLPEEKEKSTNSQPFKEEISDESEEPEEFFDRLNKKK